MATSSIVFVHAPLGELTCRLLPLWLLAIVAPIMVAYVIVFYAGDRALLRAPAGITLTALRVAIGSAMLLVLLDPADVRTVEVLERGRLLLAVDTSGSMGLLDRHRTGEQMAAEARALGLAAGAPALDDADRLGLARLALSGDWLDELAAKHRLSVYSIADSAKLVSAAEAPGDVPALRRAIAGLRAEGKGTDLSEPLVGIAAVEPRDLVAGIVLVSDGNHHGSRDPRQAARALAALGIRLGAVGVGAASGPPDAVLLSAEVSGEVFAGEEVDAEVTVSTRGLGALELPLTVTEEGRRLGEATVETAPEGGTSRHIVRFPSGAPGRRRLELAFPPVAGESDPTNNHRALWLEVRREKARVLLLDGAPRWEFRRLRSLWERDEKIELAAHTATAPPEARLPPEVPRERDALYANDVIVLGDVDPSAFSRREHGWLRDFVVARGGAVVTVAGARAMPERWSETPLGALLGVEPPAPGSLLGAEPRGIATPWELRLTARGELAPLVRLVPGEQSNAEVWESLPAPSWVSPVESTRPGAVVLVEARPRSAGGVPSVPATPLIVTRNAGAGRVLSIGTDATWKWRRGAGDILYRRFWGRVARWGVSSHLTASDGNVRVGTNRLVYRLPSRIEVDAAVEKAPGKPLEDARVEAVITPRTGPRAPSGQTRLRLRLDHVPQSGGRYHGVLEEGKLTPLLSARETSGERAAFVECDVIVEVPGLAGYNERADRARATFVVEYEREAESEDLARNASLLAELAQLTGGRYAPLDRFREVTASIPPVTRKRAREQAAGLLDYPLLVAVSLLALVALEWVLRRRWHLA